MISNVEFLHRTNSRIRLAAAYCPTLDLYNALRRKFDRRRRMAGEGKGKHGKRRSPSVSEDGGGRGKRRKEEDKKKGLSKKSSKGSRDDSEKKKKSKEKRHHKHHRKHSQDSNFKDLSDDDYFSKNNEFSTWLKEEKGVFFSDLSSEDARKLFSKFVKDWNDHKLDSRYYEGIASAARTAHKWNIVKEN